MYLLMLLLVLHLKLWLGINRTIIMCSIRSQWHARSVGIGWWLLRCVVIRQTLWNHSLNRRV